MLKPLTSDDPENIGPYRLHGRLGSGSSGTVYAAQRHSAQGQAKAGDLAAVKVPKSENYDMTEFCTRFSGEIDAIRLVKSEFVPGFIDSAVDAGSVWMAAELIPGLSLDDIISPSAALEKMQSGISGRPGCMLSSRSMPPASCTAISGRKMFS